MRSYDSTEFYSTSSVVTLVHLHATVYRSYLSLNKVATGIILACKGQLSCRTTNINMMTMIPMKFQSGE